METRSILQKIQGFFSGATGNATIATRAVTIAGGLYMLIQAYKQLKLSKGLDRFKQFGAIITGGTLIYKGLTSPQIAS